jgi:hypothetical protein
MSLSLLAGKAVAVVMAATAPAAFGLQVSPIHVSARAGGSAVLTVRDVGTKPLLLSTSLLRVRGSNGACGVTASGLPRGITISPASLRVRPGHARTATVHVASSVPASDVAVIFSEQDGSRGAVHVSGAVGVQLIITAPGKAVAHRCVAVRAAPPKPGFPARTVEGAGGAAVLLMGAGVWFGLRRRRSDPDGKGGRQTMS